MKKNKLILAASAAVLTAAALAMTPLSGVPSQSGQDQALEGLLRPGRPSSPSLGGSVDALDLEEIFRLRLMQPDLDEREAAFEEIAAQVMDHPAARTALESIAADTGDPNLAFTARLALREADRGGIDRPMTVVDPFEAMQLRMQEMLENGPLMGDFFSAGPLGGSPFLGRRGNALFRRRPGLFGSRGAQGVDPFEDLRLRTDAIRKQLEDLRSGAPQLDAGPTHGSSSSSFRSSSMVIERTSDGVRVEITEDDGSGPKTSVYEAPTMEALLAANPELKGRVR